MKKRIIFSISMLILCFFVINFAVSAHTDSVGNVFFSDADPGTKIIDRDLYWAGNSWIFTDYQVGKSMLAAGKDITVNETEIGGSLRAAAYTIILNGVDVADNITAGAYSLQLSGVTASGIYLAGNTVYFNGTADYACLAGNTITLDGEISGNVDLYAENVVLGENLKVDGILTIESGDKPGIPSGAAIGQFIFKETETKKSVNNAADIAAEETKPVKSSSLNIGKFIKGALGAILSGALICLLLGSEELSKPGKMLLTRPFPMLGTGLAGIFVIPGIILFLFFTGFGFSSGSLLAMLFSIACIYSLSYTGATLAKTLIPMFTNNKILNNEWVCVVIGAFIFWLLRKIPYVGLIILAASIIYTIGYFLQTIYLRLANRKSLTAGKPTDVLENISCDHES